MNDMRRGPAVIIAARRRQAMIIAAGILLLTGCASGAADDTSAASPAADAAIAVTAPPTLTRNSVSPIAVEVTLPAQFVQRTTLPSCGTYDGRLRPPSVPKPSTEPWTCLRDAIGSPEGAELVVVQSTVEGDLVRDYVRALPGGGIEVFSDQTQDKFGTQVWTRATCTGIEAKEWIRQSGCTEPVEYLARPLTGRWVLQMEGVPTYFITFRDDGTWTSEDECDGGSGTYSVDHVGTFSFTATGAKPSVKCDPERAQESLERTSRVIATVNRLTALDVDGDHTAWFTATRMD